MKIIGLTGGVACGKTTVAKLLVEKGFPVIDTDEIAHDLLERDLNIQKKILELFGTLERLQLREQIFKDSDKRKKIERILHPRIWDIVQKRLGALKSQEPMPTAVIVVIPLLYETGLGKKVDQVLSVISFEENQMSRLLKRDGISQELAKRMISSQWLNEDKAKRSHFVIRNDGTLLELSRQVDKIYLKIWESVARQK